MSQVQINQLPGANTIDGSADVLPIWTSSLGITQSINRNTYLGVPGQPMDISSTQNVTNKTLNNTNTITVKDGSFTLNNSSDVTKVGKFSLSGNTTGTTRTYMLPNASVTLASLTGTETLTNKTLTSPAITGGTYDNGAITVDSISGHTTSTIVTVGGVQMNNGVIGTANAVTSNSITAGAVTPNALIASSGTGWAYQTWSPTWTNLTVGNGTQVARYVQIGKTILFWNSLILGSTSSVGTAPVFTLPVTAQGAYPSAAYGNIQIGGGLFVRSGDNAYQINVLLLSTTTARFGAIATNGSYATGVVAIDSSTPASWASPDTFEWWGTYETA